jgi:hypothetical protein
VGGRGGPLDVPVMGVMGSRSSAETRGGQPSGVETRAAAGREWRRPGRATSLRIRCAGTVRADWPVDRRVWAIRSCRIEEELHPPPTLCCLAELLQGRPYRLRRPTLLWCVPARKRL